MLASPNSYPDHLNTPRLVADANQQTVWKWDQQEPFGVNVPDENPSGLGAFDLPLRLPGQYFDKETNNHYNYFRGYDPSLGRYVESDPIGLRAGLNTYAYVGGAPLNYVDSLGLDRCNCIALSGVRPSTTKSGVRMQKICTYDCTCTFTACNQEVTRTISDFKYDHGTSDVATCFGQTNMNRGATFNYFSFSPDHIGDRYFNPKTPDREFMDNLMNQMRSSQPCCKSDQGSR